MLISSKLTKKDIEKKSTELLNTYFYFDKSYYLE